MKAALPKNEMEELKSHEQIVLDILVSNVIAEDTLKDIKRNPIFPEYDVTGHGYFLTLRHPSLPLESIVCDKPMIIGECDGIETGFVVFIENGELTIECHGWDDSKIPRNYRELDIQIVKA